MLLIVLRPASASNLADALDMLDKRLRVNGQRLARDLEKLRDELRQADRERRRGAA